MNTDQFAEYFISAGEFSDNLSLKHIIPEKTAQFAEIPHDLHRSIREYLTGQGIDKLYSHQAKAFKSFREGKNLVITTPTASGKTLSYLLPLLQDKLENPNGKYVFLFPTKALAQDQLAIFRKVRDQTGNQWSISTFDGDTPAEERRRVKKSGDFILTNPDMLHAGILPHHTTWKNFFENLRAIIIDEMHTYVGVFGSHVGNVFRRFNRLLLHYGAQPRYIFSSATIANPAELALSLSERECSHIGQSGAPEGKKYIFFYNPPFIDKELTRQSPYRAAASIGSELIRNNISGIYFARSRIRTEILNTLLQNKLPRHLKHSVRAYRGGYLPLERRSLEKNLREGKLKAIVSTNALELGIDIGSLSAVVSVGYPGRISSLLQQFGRAGRKKESALAIMIATPSALDQYLMNHPDHILQGQGEPAVINPGNMTIFFDHLKCAAFEMRFKEGDIFGGVQVDPYLEHLCDEKVLLKNNGEYFWTQQTYPAGNISLRSAAQDNFVIVDITEKGREKVIGETDYFSAPMLIHEEAIYLHQGSHYYVKSLIWEKRRAEVEKIQSDYYTDAHQKAEFRVLAVDEKKNYGNLNAHFGEITLITKAFLYKKIKISTNENLGWGNILTPEIEMHTQSGWVSFTTDLGLQMPETARSGVLIRTAHIMRQMAPLVALCDQNDIRVTGLYKDPQFELFCLIFYDNYPGGVGLSYKLVQNFTALLDLSLRTVSECKCQDGCPSCVGVWDSPPEEQTFLSEAEAKLPSPPQLENLKNLVKNLLQKLMNQYT